MAPPRARTSRLVALLAVAALLALAACSDDKGDSSQAREATTTTSTVVRPKGPKADVSQVLRGGKGVFLGSATPVRLPDRWVEDERVAAGTAESYRSDGPLPTDGRFDLATRDSADYRTRVVVRRPRDGDDFNGTVVVEWLNVSGEPYRNAAEEVSRAIHEASSRYRRGKR